MAVHVDVLTEFDNRSVISSANDLQRHLERTGDESGRAFSSSLSREVSGGLRGLNGLVAEFGRGLRSGIDGELRGMGTSFDAVGSRVSGIGAAGFGAVAGVAAIGAAAVVVGKQFYDVGARFDAVADGIAVQTGKIGSDLDALTKSIGNVANTTASSIEDIANIGGRVSQSFGLTGQPLEDLTKQIADLNRMTGQSLDIREFGMAMRGFGEDGTQATQSLDQLTAASQRTGIPLGALVNTMGNIGPAARSLGLDMNETAGMIVSFEKAGIDADKTVQGLNRAASTFADHGINLQTGLADTITQIRGFIDAGNEAAAVDLAGKVFGTRGAQTFVDAIRQGTLNVQSLQHGLGNTGNTIANLDKQTRDWAENWATIKNRVLDLADTVGGPLFSALNSALGVLNDVIAAPVQMPSGPSGPLPLGYAPTNPLNALGAPGGPPPPPSGSAAPADLYGPNTPPWLQAMLPPAPPPGGYPGGPPPQDIAGALAKGSGSGGPKAPQLPYPAEYGQPALPGETPQHWHDRMNIIDTQHNVAEKRARVDQLEKDSTATQDDIVKARNDLIDAQMRQTESEQKLNQLKTQDIQMPYPAGYGAPPRPGESAQQYSSEQSYYEAVHKRQNAEAQLAQIQSDGTHTAGDLVKVNNDLTKARGDEYQAQLRLSDSANKTKGALDEIGAKLDPDLGISKGLSGIADNVVRFLGNLIAAPELAKLNAISAASPSQGGYGLMGVMGAQGAFGPRFTGIDSSQQGYGYGGGGYGPSALGPAAWQPTSTAQPGMSQPGESARDFAHRVMMPFWQNQGLQVGDHAADKYGEHQNGAIDIMVGTIAEGNKVLQQVLSDPNVYGAIFNNQTYGYGHGTTPQPYGSTGGPTDKHEDHVHAWYKPGGGGNIAPPVGGGGASGGLSPQQWNNIAGAEASGNWAINSGNGYSGGLQFDPNTWNQYGGQQYAPQAWQATPQQQMTVGNQVLAGQGPGAWPATSAANPGWFQPAGGGGAGPLPSIIPGSGGGQGYMGLGGGPSLGVGAGIGPGIGGPGIGGAAGGPGVGPTQIGAAVAPPGGSGKGGVGITPGGSVDTALNLAASALPGVGQAAATGAKLASRAIQYAGQVAGIGVQGAMETFLPTGGSQLASNSWFSKIIGGLAGAAPALPNMAGKPAAPPPQQQQPGGVASGQGQGPPPGPPQITVNNQRANEDGTGRDIAYHLQGMYEK